jgi:AAA domain
MFSSTAFTSGFVPPDYVLVGVLQRRFLYSCTGATGDGKTTWLLLLAAHVALKRALGSHEVKPGAVVVLAGENPDDVRMRWIAMAEHMGFDPNTIDVHFVPGVFPIKAVKREVENAAKERGITFSLVIVDTSAAYFPGNDENNNAQAGSHARELRTLVELPGGPCVLVSCHPTKNADRDNLLPRGGGAYVAEVDGNLICRKSGGDNVSEIHWHGKFRGADFNPLAFETRQVSSVKLVDSDGSSIPTVIGFPLDETEQSSKRAESRGQEDKVLLLLVGKEGLSLAQVAQRADWLTKAGEPNKSKAQRVMIRLRDAHLVKNDRGDWQLTEAGSKAARRAEGRWS